MIVQSVDLAVGGDVHLRYHNPGRNCSAVIARLIRLRSLALFVGVVHRERDGRDQGRSVVMPLALGRGLRPRGRLGRPTTWHGSGNHERGLLEISAVARDATPPHDRRRLRVEGERE